MSPSLLSLAAALENLGANPLRTLLSTLGVIIGVASLVAILALGDGLEQFGREQIGRTTDLQTLTVAPRLYDVEGGVRVWREERPVLTRGDALDLRTRLSGRADVALFLVASARASAGSPAVASATATPPPDTAQRAVMVLATGPEAASQLPEGLVAGRYLTGADVAADRGVVVVPAGVADWYGVDPAALPGRSLWLDGVAREVVGVFAGPSRGPVQVHIPLSDAARSALEQRDRVAALAVRAHRVEEVEALGAEVEGWLEGRFGEAGAFTVASNKARAAQVREAMLVFKLVMGAIGGIALLVGGIGIMNILLASVFERTREIGIRKASGARQRHVLIQFLAESVAITGIGSVIGVVVGLVGAFGITAAIRRFTEGRIYAAFTWESVAAAVVAALLVGLIFGTYPARRAARLSPIEAMRHE